MAPPWKCILHIWSGSLFIISLIAAILSTVNSALLSASALLCHNIIIHNFKKPPTDRICLMIERIGVVFVGLIAYCMAFRAENVYSLVLEAEGFGSAGVFVCFALGILTKYGNKLTGAITLLVGLSSSIIL